MPAGQSESYDIAMSKTIPFVANTDDDLHCLQAAFMSILRYFNPDANMDWDEWSRLTGFEKGKGTWPIAGLVWFHQQGFDVQHIESFDFNAFSAHGETYLRQRYPGETGEWAIEHTNIPAEQKRAQELSKLGIFENREPTLQDIKIAIDEGYLVRVHVNSRQLNNEAGYFGHAVVVFDYDNLGVTLHDPGLPAIPNRKVLFEDFERAWHNPDDGSAELSAIRLT